MPFLKKDKNSETYHILGLVGSFGFTTAGAIAGGYFIGSYLDRKFNTSPWIMISFIMLGIIGSFIELFKLARKLFHENRKDT